MKSNIDIEAERQLFESTLEGRANLTKDEEGDYVRGITQAAWWSWQDRAALAASPRQVACYLIEITDSELKDLHRFSDTCEDSESYDIPKPRMQRLAAIGLIRRTHANCYEITDFGQVVIEVGFPPAAPQLSSEEIPTWQDQDKRGGIKVPGTVHQLMQAEIDALRSLLAEIRPAVARSRDDTVRIDWLDAQDYIHAVQWQCGGRGSPIKTSFYDRDRILIAEGISLRHAIDAAMLLHLQDRDLASAKAPSSSKGM